ncbi:T9SS type A sorting domain-containing protein [Neolewinella persica]|uniref:T9SS type A sorting domain-containing protein n=1 Tax=Neolewinella persica TaxID=70998 RepID=UPI00039CBFE0|nr:T9SS type A sorting domain-containing protein [Neolewinella persica]
MMLTRYPYFPTLLLLFFSLSAPITAQTLLRNIGQDSLLGTTELGSSSPIEFTRLNDTEFVFQGFVSGFELGNLHVSDGTEAGTNKVGTVTAQGQMIHFQGRVYFAGTDFAGGQATIGLWVTDGTAEGTELVFASEAGSATFPLDPKDFFVLDTLLLFSGLTITHGTELWRTDGTAAGTRLIADVNPDGDGYAGGEPTVVDSILYFAGYTPDAGVEPWRTDGTPEGTWMIADMNPGPQNSGAAFFTASGGFIYFSALAPGSGREVRRMRPERGSAIELIGEGGGSTDSSDPRYFVDADGTLFYVAQTEGADGLELMRYNHVGEPEVMGPTDIFPQILKPFGNGRIVFKARNANGTELWISDGTSGGTHPITDLYAGPNDGVFPNVSAESFHVYQDSLVYYAGADGTAADGEFVYELFVTDGTEAGTVLVSDQVPGTEGSNPGNFFTFRERVYFAATDPLVGREPFYLGPGEPPVSIFRPVVSSLRLQARVFPNPIRAGAAFRLEMELDTPLKLTAGLYDLRGVLVRDLPLPSGQLQVGNHSMPWQLPADISSGIYFIRLISEGKVASLRVVVAE